MTDAARHSAAAIIKDEHRSMAAILDGLLYMVRQIREGGAEPDFPLLWKMLYYIDLFPEKCHHPKEDEFLFRSIRARTKEADHVLDELSVDHQKGAELIRDLEQALGRYQGAGDDEFVVFARTVERYAEFHWKHMRKEEEIILPIAARVLTEADWQWIDSAFRANADPLLGIVPASDFKQLFSRIVAMAPPPIGVGPEPAAASAADR